MNTAKLVNSALTGGGLIYPENLNVIIGSENKGYPKGTVLDANATLSLVGSNGNQNESNLGFQISNNKFEKALNDKDVIVDNILLKPNNYDRKNILLVEEGEYIGDDTISGLSNIVIGPTNYIIGPYNIAIGETVYSNAAYNVLNGGRTVIPIVKNTENDKIRIKARVGSQAMELLENGLLYAATQFIVKNNKVLRNDKATKDPIKIVNYTRISDEIIQLEDPGLETLKDSEKIVFIGIYNTSKNSIAAGTLISAINANKSISVGSSLKDEAVNNVYPNTYQVFGYMNTVKNNFEFACGARNVSTKNDNFQTRFSVGAGTSPTDYKNAFEIGFKKSGSDYNANTYVLGVGGYNGKNAADNNTKSLQQVINDINPNSVNFDTADKVLKCINSKPLQPQSLDILDCIKDVLKRGWKNIAVNAMFTKDNEWIISNQTLFKKGTENKISTELTLAEIKSNSENKFITIDDLCVLVKLYGASVYVYVQNPNAKNAYAKAGDLYDGKPYIHKLIYTLNIFGLHNRYSIIAVDRQVLQQVLMADSNARVGLFFITKFYTDTQLSSSAKSFITDAKSLMSSESENLFIISNLNIANELPISVTMELARAKCKLEVANFDNNTNVDNVKSANQYITAALCDDVHIGQKILESNV